MIRNITARALAALVVLGVPQMAAADATIEITKLRAFETTPVAKSAAGYLTLTNSGDAPAHLSGVRADFANAMLHKSETKDGVTSMHHLHDGIVIPPGESAILEPGGLHLMFMGLTAPFVVGETRSVTLVFETLGEIEITLPITTRSAGSGHGTHDAHAGHDSHSHGHGGSGTHAHGQQKSD